MEQIFERAFEAPITRRQLIKSIAAAGAATYTAGALAGLAGPTPAPAVGFHALQRDRAERGRRASGAGRIRRGRR